MDTIANLITAISNAERVNHPSLQVPASHPSESVLATLKANGYIRDYRSVTASDGSGHPRLEIDLVARANHAFKRVSKPGRRVYTPAKGIPVVKQGFGLVVISTSEGVMSGSEAKKRGLGGEVLCTVA